MTEDYTEAADKYALPRGMGNLAAFITIGKSFFGYDLKRDGLPEVVVRAHERIGVEGVVAIVRLAHTLKPFPVLDDAAALTEWGIEHYVGQQIALKGDGLQPEWDARGMLMRRHVMQTWGKEVAKIKGAPEDWADLIDWPQAAANAEATGDAMFTESGPDHTNQIEVDMFGGSWPGIAP